MLQNAYFLANIGADTAENEQQFAEILPTDGADGADGGSEKRCGPPSSVTWFSVISRTDPRRSRVAASLRG